MSDPTSADRATPNHKTSEFERLRPYLLRVAYSHLGTLGEAEDVVQEAWLRLEGADLDEIRDLRAWLTTVVSRIALDALTSARTRRERYVGPWLPEPVVDAGTVSADPVGRVELDESVSMALLIVLESLSPAERSAFLLHDVFGYSFGEVARIVGRTPQATRQLAARARNAVEARRPRYPATEDEQRKAVEAFLTATENGDIATLLELLDPEVTFRSDGGGLVPAARSSHRGRSRRRDHHPRTRDATRRPPRAGSCISRSGKWRTGAVGGRWLRAERHFVHARSRPDHRDRLRPQSGETQSARGHARERSAAAGGNRPVNALTRATGEVAPMGNASGQGVSPNGRLCRLGGQTQQRGDHDFDQTH